jgi:hypothetical protein
MVEETDISNEEQCKINEDNEKKADEIDEEEALEEKAEALKAELENDVKEAAKEEKAVEVKIDLRDRFTLGAITAAFAIGLLAGAILEKFLGL